MNPVTEQELAAAAVAPRVTEEHLQDIIASAHYFTARDGVMGELASDGVKPTSFEQSNCPSALGLLTFCVLVLKNGFTVVGHEACASPENFNADTGRRLAYQDAFGKLWAFEGYVLRNKLAGLS